MAWTIASRSIQDGSLLHIRWSGFADASALSAQAIVDLSTLSLPGGAAPTKARVLGGFIRCGGIGGVLEYDHTTDQLIATGVDGVEIPLCPPPQQCLWSG